MKLKLLSAAMEVALFFKKLYRLDKKASYEDSRLSERNNAADAFERKFNPNGLRSSEGVPGNKTDNG